ncbi:MAG: hypothetical protein WBH36_06640, partial [Syntrophobacteria bacterium]
LSPPQAEGIKGRGTQSQSVERKCFSLCAMRIFTPTLTLPRPCDKLRIFDKGEGICGVSG